MVALPLSTVFIRVLVATSLHCMAAFSIAGASGEQKSNV